MNEITVKLEKIGLKHNESAAYLALLRLSEASANEIAAEADLERTTVYKILEGLVERGLITKNMHGKRIVYFSQGPQALKLFLNSQNEVLNEIFPSLLAMYNADATKPKVSFYDTLPAIKEVYNSSLNATEPIRRDIISIDNIVDLLGQRFIQNHTNNRVERKIAVRSIRSFSDQDSKVEQDWTLKSSNTDLLREVKHLKGLEFTPLIMLFDHTIAMISTQKDPFALVIESKELSDLLKMFFDLVWTNVAD